ncbi:MAG: (d)CMP kinase [Solobacterium sp.]|jgi:cytidylate kinase|nr:(d)CMP kinase [Solobacterium sp.]MCH4049864.1 (d)CMP kinase [Solobacterium sp.]MCH4073549.1 (d)CMP kinase [Solobacterium sp.]MCI1312920.1 (d)CMP kinase [Solobacterium sp.]MCI1406743.1 (d)CMP kinase [Solobacterium sp.]
MRINIAIDGPSAAGKSTIAKKAAARLGYVHLDTGAMYRCTAYKALEQGISLEDEDAICHMLENTDIVLTPQGNVLLDGKDVSDVIREEKTSMAASKVSKLGRVRKELVKRQQKMAEAKGFIMDGRDIGTVVLPHAEVKIFMTASPEARAKRRYDQDQLKGIESGSLEQIASEIRARDEQDMNRKESPLRKADDAVLLDTSNMSIDEVADAVVKMAQERIGEQA